MNRKKFNFLYLSGLVIISFILRGCYPSEEYDDYTYKFPPWVGIEVSYVSDSSVLLKGQFKFFDNYTITGFGFCWSSDNKNPAENDNQISCGQRNSSSGSFSFALVGLEPDITYYVRTYIKCNSSKFASYSPSILFGFSEGHNGIMFNHDLSYGTLKDVENNTYKTIQIGNQVWMAENLKTTRFIDASGIPKTEDAQVWGKLNTPAYCWYSNDSLKYKVYGALYNWYAVNTGKLCPSGWHVPADSDWVILSDYLGGQAVAGNKLKEIGNLHWKWPPGNISTNESGFTALPGGGRYGYFDYDGVLGLWWSAQENDAQNGKYWGLDNDSGPLIKIIQNKNGGFSVRCIKD